MFAKWEIAEAEALSCAYVQQLMTTLKTGGLCRQSQGQSGWLHP